MNKHFYIFFIAVLFMNALALAQDSTSNKSLFDEGLGVRGGIGYMAVRDEYISDEKYSGTIPFYAMSWSRFHETYGFRLDLEYQFTPDLRNNNVSTQITQVRIGLDYLYPLSDISFMSKKMSIFLGPTCQLFVHSRSENIGLPSSSDIPYANSFAFLLSGGIRAEGFYPVAKDLEAQLMAQTSILSFAERSTSGSDEPNSKILPLPNLIDAAGGIGIIYKLTGPLSAMAEYRFDLVRITSWDFFISGNDNFILSLKYVL